jgi:Fe-S-cluster-containing dehydrogenase component/DMSO reductase anchor subunit
VTLTAVERFAGRHDEGRLPAAGPYRARLPVTAPAPGQQYAFEVDLDSCTGCKACVTACNSVNGLDADESWRRVGLLIGTAEAYQQTVTAACHHCVDPACMTGCPVDAYEKDPVSGIVEHLDDQCIGCRYCTLTCPYEVPRFNNRLGIVRKCDLCSSRLAVGDAPACAEGCPNDAISITVVDVDAERAWPLPESPSPRRTRPTTVYRSRRPIPDTALPADHFEVRPAAAHDPLAVMLTLSQLAVGTYLAAPGRALAALGAAIAAMTASLAHLGRPLLAWKAVIGLRHSWVSREIVALAAFTALAGLHALVAGLGVAVPVTLVVVTAIAGIAAVVCSIAIYAATGRQWWSAGRLTGRFGSTTLACGLSVASISGAAVPAVLLVTLTLVRLATGAAGFRHRRRPLTELGRTASLLSGELWPRLRTRVVLAVAGGVVLPLLVAATRSPLIGLAGLAVLAAGEYVDRTLLFTASAAPRMPGDRR